MQYCVLGAGLMGRAVAYDLVTYGHGATVLLADIDLLGVLPPHRRSGLGTALARRAIEATRELAGDYGLPALGVVSLADPNDAAILGLHEKLGGQIRTDVIYPSGDIIVWYPLLEQVATVETAALAQQLQQFGRLLGWLLLPNQVVKVHRLPLRREAYNDSCSGRSETMAYEYRRMTDDERTAVVESRRQRGYPLHAPPHPYREAGWYFLTATNFEHQPVMRTPENVLATLTPEDRCPAISLPSPAADPPMTTFWIGPR